jgi:predicted dehydrogenase
VHLCLVGCGYIASHHARLLKRLEGSSPKLQISFASRDLAKAEAFRNSFGGSLAFGSYRDACSHPAVQAVVVCTPNVDHHQTALQAISYGKHAIIEKPFATSVAEADEVLARAAQAGVCVLVAENHRYFPHVRWLERLLATGELGALKMVRLNYMRKLRFREGEWRASFEAMGGGVLIDGGIHWVNTMLTLGGGEASEITAVESMRSLAGCPGEDTIVVTCALKNGAVGVLTYSWNIEPSFPDRFMAIHGDKGSAYADNGGKLGLTFVGARPRLKLFPRSDREGFLAMWQDFLSNLARGSCSQCLATGEVGRRDLAFVEAAYRSSTTSARSIS